MVNRDHDKDRENAVAHTSTVISLLDLGARPAFLISKPRVAFLPILNIGSESKVLALSPTGC